MTKEEKIQEAWGDVWKELPSLQKEGALKHNGWVSHLGYSIEDKDLVKKLYQISKKEGWLVCDQFTFRPVSLSGIEYNNGWIKIDSEEDLPEESWNYWIMQNDGRISAMKDYFDNKKYYGVAATHYQPIEKPKPPIY